MFEQEFMDILSSIISLCVELSHNKADYIFAYLFVDNKKTYFNAIFRFGKETWDIEDLEYPTEVAEEFYELVNQEIIKLPEIFEKYKREKPLQYKMKFHTKTQKFKFDLKYAKEINASLSPEQVFFDWMQSIKRKRILFFN